MRRRVLVVEDAPDLLFMVEVTLTMGGHTVLKALSGEDALAQLEQEDVDVVILDLGLPGITGHEVLQRLRRHPRLYGLPVIVVSANASPATVAEILSLGVERYLTKPFDPHELLQVLGTIASSAGRSS